MQLHEIQSRTKRKRSRQVGRGGKRGTTAGRGTKGQKARAGHSIRPELRDMIKKLPKRRGRGKNSNKSIASYIRTISLANLERGYNKGEQVSLKTLRERSLITRWERAVKVVGKEGLTKALNFKGLKFSAGAKQAIESLGGKLE
ncbi:MAG: uL15 family ribosomal protein [bacterium]|nr:uL15 family ribosomal protein [bacterium]